MASATYTVQNPAPLLCNWWEKCPALRCGNSRSRTVVCRLARHLPTDIDTRRFRSAPGYARLDVSR
jgi:hypothetical protein